MAGKSKRSVSSNAPAVKSYQIKGGPGGKPGNFVVVVTSGRLQGRQAKVITTPPSAAYFNQASKGK